MNCLYSICGFSRIAGAQSEGLRRRCSKEVGVGDRKDQSVLRQFNHVERIKEQRLVRKMYKSYIIRTRRENLEDELAV